MIEHDPDHPDSAERWISDALQSLRDQIVARDAEIKRLRAGFLKSIQDGHGCDDESACHADEACVCALELELRTNRSTPKEGI